jgi:hypothetical protein
MKNQNYLKTGLVIVGAISLIIMMCSAKGSNNSNTNNSSSGIGKYQITDRGSSTYGSFHILDTETGVVKTYSKLTQNSNYVLINTTITQ